jgi:5-methylthioribose kinase
LLLHYASQEHWSPNEASRQERRQYLIHTVRDIWTNFERNFRALWEQHGQDRIAKTAGYQDWYLRSLLQDTAGFAGSKMVRRIVGLAHVADIDRIPDQDVRAKAQRLALSIGKNLIKRNRQLTSIEELIAIVDEASRA